MVAGDSLSSYYNYVYSAPVLSFDEEQALATNVFNDGDVSSAQKLIISHLRLVAAIAKKYTNYQLCMWDLIQEGNIGLMKAVNKFDPKKKWRLATFANMYIKGHIYEYILNNWKPIKLATTKALRKAFFNVRKLRTDTFDNLTKESERNLIATKLDISVDDVHTMEERMSSNFSSELHNSNTGDVDSYDELIASRDMTPDEIVIAEQHEDFIKDNVMGLINSLNARDKDIILSRKFTEKPTTLSELSKKYDISIERVRQLESNTIKKLEAVVKEQK